MTKPVEKTTQTRRRFLLTCGAGAVALGLGPSLKILRGPLKGLKLTSRTSRALGTDITMQVLHADSSIGERALDAAFAELARVERVMSIYLPQSQVSMLNTAGILRDPDPYLVQVLKQSSDVSRRSGGAFDITVQPLWELYFAAQRNGRLPADEAIEAARERVDWQGVSVAADEIRLHAPNMAITLNGIAQGFAADRAMEALKRNGIEHALVNTGEISSLGRKPGDEPWVVGIQHPRQTNAYLGLAKLDGRCMSTSGDYSTAFTPDFAYNHIFDPATGRSPEVFSSVTVVAPDATMADALSTAIFVLGPERGLALAQETPGTDVLLVMKDAQIFATPSFPWSTGKAPEQTRIAS